MGIYYLDWSDLVRVLIPQVNFESLIRATNKEFVALNDPKEQRFIVQCENKPKDSPVLNVFWKEQPK